MTEITNNDLANAIGGSVAKDWQADFAGVQAASPGMKANDPAYASWVNNSAGLETQAMNLANVAATVAGGDKDTSTWIDSTEFQASHQGLFNNTLSGMTSKLGAVANALNSNENAKKHAEANVAVASERVDLLNKQEQLIKDGYNAAKWGPLQPLLGLFSDKYDLDKINGELASNDYRLFANDMRLASLDQSMLHSEYGKAGYNPLAAEAVKPALEWGKQYVDQQTALQRNAIAAQGNKTAGLEAAARLLGAVNDRGRILASVLNENTGAANTIQNNARSLADMKTRVYEQNEATKRAKMQQDTAMEGYINNLMTKAADVEMANADLVNARAKDANANYRAQLSLQGILDTNSTNREAQSAQTNRLLAKQADAEKARQQEQLGWQHDENMQASRERITEMSSKATTAYADALNNSATSKENVQQSKAEVAANKQASGTGSSGTGAKGGKLASGFTPLQEANANGDYISGRAIVNNTAEMLARAPSSIGDYKGLNKMLGLQASLYDQLGTMQAAALNGTEIDQNMYNSLRQAAIKNGNNIATTYDEATTAFINSQATPQAKKLAEAYVANGFKLDKDSNYAQIMPALMSSINDAPSSTAFGSTPNTGANMFYETIRPYMDKYITQSIANYNRTADDSDRLDLSKLSEDQRRDLAIQLLTDISSGKSDPTSRLVSQDLYNNLKSKLQNKTVFNSLWTSKPDDSSDSLQAAYFNTVAQEIDKLTVESIIDVFNSGNPSFTITEADKTSLLNPVGDSADTSLEFRFSSLLLNKGISEDIAKQYVLLMNDEKYVSNSIAKYNAVHNPNSDLYSIAANALVGTEDAYKVRLTQAVTPQSDVTTSLINSFNEAVKYKNGTLKAEPVDIKATVDFDKRFSNAWATLENRGYTPLLTADEVAENAFRATLQQEANFYTGKLDPDTIQAVLADPIEERGWMYPLTHFYKFNVARPTNSYGYTTGQKAYLESAYKKASKAAKLAKDRYMQQIILRAEYPESIAETGGNL